jgi:hypothetical protein
MIVGYNPIVVCYVSIIVGYPLLLLLNNPVIDSYILLSVG